MDLIERVRRGKNAISIARERGMDTAAWEAFLEDLERQELLAWASAVAEQNIVLDEAVIFIEEAPTTVTVTRISKYVVGHLRFIVHARFQQRAGGFGAWLPPWWRDREQAAIGALVALRSAVDGNLRVDDLP